MTCRLHLDLDIVDRRAREAFIDAAVRKHNAPLHWLMRIVAEAIENGPRVAGLRFPHTIHQIRAEFAQLTGSTLP